MPAPSSSPPARPQRTGARRNRARILAAAVGAFAAEGLSVSVREIVRRAGPNVRRLTATSCPGPGVFEFSALVAEVATDRGLAETVAGPGLHRKADTARAAGGVIGALRTLLARAQRAGAVRGDVDADEVAALVAGCADRESCALDPAVRDRRVDIVRQGRPAGGG